MRSLESSHAGSGRLQDAKRESSRVRALPMLGKVLLSKQYDPFVLDLISAGIEAKISRIYIEVKPQSRDEILYSILIFVAMIDT